MIPYNVFVLVRGTVLAFIVGALILLAACGSNRHDEENRKIQLEKQALELQINDLKTSNAKLKQELEHEKSKPVEIKYVDRIVENEQKSMTFFKIMGMWIMGLSVGAGIILHFLIPSMWYFGAAGLGTGGFFYYCALTNQFLTPFMPYFVLAAATLIFFGAVIYAYKRINWTPDEKQGLNDIAHGDSTSDAAKKLLEDVLVKSKPKFWSLIPSFLQKRV